MNSYWKRSFCGWRASCVAALEVAMICLLLVPAALAEVSLTVSWNRSTSPTVTGYYVYSFEEDSLVPVRLDAGNNNQFTISNLKEGYTYRMAVTAHNVLGCESPPSEMRIYWVPVPLQILSPSATTGLARLRFPVVPGHLYEVEASTDLKNWITIWQTNGAAAYSWVEFQDPQSEYFPIRFYRLRFY